MNVFDYIEKELDRIEVGYTSYDGTKITLTMDEVRELVQNLRKKYKPDEDTISRQAAIDALKRLQKDISGDYTELDPMVMAGCGYIGDCIGELECLPSAQPDVPDTNAGDLISRAAAIETQEKIMADHPLDGYEDGLSLINALNDLPPAQPDQQTIAGQKNDLIHRETARRIIDSPRSKSQMLTVLRCTPPAQPEQRWISCSERLPEKSGQYYVSGGDKVWICEFLIIQNFIGGWCNDVANPVVQAWMPLPEPYQGEGGKND